MDEEFRDIPHPMLELYTHVTLKTVQAGTLIGTLIAAPIATLRKSENRSVAGYMQKASKFGRYGIIFGVVAGPLMCYAKVRTIKNLEDGLFDRDYRLRHNRGQVRVDQGSLLGALTGAALTTGAGYGPAVGGMVGLASGVVAMAAYNSSVNTKK